MRWQLLNSGRATRWGTFSKGFLLIALFIVSSTWLDLSRDTRAAGRARPVDVGDQEYWPIPLLAREFGVQYHRFDDERFRLANREMELSFEVGGRRAFVNGVLVWLHEPVLPGRRAPMLSATDVETVLSPLLRPLDSLRQVGYQRVVLDAGHGGNDPGAQGPTGSVEKDLALTVTLGITKLLEEAGVDVYLTRRADSTLSLSNRVVRTREAGGDLFVSLHFNSSANPDAQGSETFVLTAGGHASTSQQPGGSYPAAVEANEFDGANALLGFLIQQRLLEQTGSQDRGLRRARFYVLREAVTPAVLVEAGFLTNLDEEARVLDPAFQARMIRGIADGILDYTGLVMRARIEDYL